MLHTTTSTLIQQRFPGRVVLTPEDVAGVWCGSRSSEAAGAIRKRLTHARLLPGLKKNDGRWEVPVGELIGAIEQLTAGTGEDEGSEDSSDVAEFWDKVFDALGGLEAERTRAELGAAVMEWKWISAEEHESMVRQVLSDPPDKTYTDDEVAKLAGRGVRTLRNWRKAGAGPEHTTKQATRKVTKKRTLEVKYTEIVYSHDDLLKWLKSRDLMEKSGFMMWNTDGMGRVARMGERDAGSLLDLLHSEHASRESLELALALFRQRFADELDDAAWRLAAMPIEANPTHGF